MYRLCAQKMIAFITPHPRPHCFGQICAKERVKQRRCWQFQYFSRWCNDEVTTSQVKNSFWHWFTHLTFPEHLSQIATTTARQHLRCVLSLKVAPVLWMGSLVSRIRVFSENNRLDIASNGEICDHPHPTR